MTTRLARPRGPRMSALARVVQALGPGYMKFAQILSTRDDVLPARACRALAALQDQARPMSRREMEAALAQGVPGGADSFSFFDPVSVGAGSIACVYRAARWDGSCVAVKLVRPRIVARVRADVRTISRAGRLIARFPQLRGVPLMEMVTAVGHAVLTQVDLDAERRSLDALRDSSDELGTIVVPRSHPDLSTRSALVMEFVDGVAPGDGARLRHDVRDPATGRELMTLVFDMLFTTGLVHCDMHPGNLVLRARGGAALLDAGFVHRTPDAVRVALARFFLNLGFRNGPGCSDAVLSTCAGVTETGDIDRFRAEMDDLVDRYGGRSADEFDFIDFAARLFRAQRDCGIYASSDFVFPLLALLMVDGTVRRLDPSIDFQAIARPIVFRAVAKAEREVLA